MIDPPPLPAFAVETMHLQRLRREQERCAVYIGPKKGDHIAELKKPVIVNGIAYECASTACHATGIPSASIRAAARDGGLGRYNNTRTGRREFFKARFIVT